MTAPAVSVCVEFAASGECLGYEWVDYVASGAPWLDVEGAIQIAIAIGGVWAVAFVFRLLRLQLEQAIKDKV